MTRTLTITRKENFQGKITKWRILLDGRAITMIGNGETQSFQIDERAHELEVVPLNALGKPVHGMDSRKTLIMSGTNNCKATVSIGLGMLNNHIKTECTYEGPVLSEEVFIHAVTVLITNIFNGNAILDLLNDPNNRRNDLRVCCLKDGVHIQWYVKESTFGKNWSTGYDEEIVPYEAANVTMPKENLTPDLLKSLDTSVKNGILSGTGFIMNKYGGFEPGKLKSRLY